MYILDEVDAALDLSHTQNIGQLLRTRFKGSQFIVVSLKDGMFNNANVLFRTRFVDGTSVIEASVSRFCFLLLLTFPNSVHHPSLLTSNLRLQAENAHEEIKKICQLSLRMFQL